MIASHLRRDALPAIPSRRTATVALVVLVFGVVFASLAVSGVVGADDAPGEPVNIYGTATDEADNPVPEGTTIYAVVDGEVEDSITVEDAGAFGGPDAFDERLVVNTGAGDEVTFTVGDVDGAMAFETVDLDDADDVVEVALTFPGETFAESPALAGLSLDLDATTIQPGGTTTATATATFEDGSESDVTDAATIGSLDPAVATVSGATVVGESAGTATIQAEYTVDGTTETDTAEVTVEEDDDPASLESVTVALAETTIAAGAVTDVTVTAAFSDGTESDVTDTATIESLDPAVATVSGATVTGESPGTATIQAEYTVDGTTETDTAEMTVEEADDPVELDAVTLDLAETTIVAGETTTATVTATFSDGSEATVTDAATIESLDPGIASVESDTVIGTSPGTATIEATYTHGEATASDDGTTASDTAELTVEEADESELESVTLALDAATIEAGETTAATVTAAFSDGTESDVTGEASIESLDTAVATVADGSVTGESAGTATIQAEYTDGESTATDTVEVTVEAAGEAAFEVTDIDAPATSSPGETLTVTATVTNVGDAAGTVTVTYAFQGTVENETTVDLAAGGETTLQFAVVAPDGDGDVEHTISAAEDSATATTTVASDGDPDDGDSGDGADDSDPGDGDPADSADDGDPGDGTDDDSGDEAADDDESGPGFGVVVALAALLALFVGYRIRNRDGRE